MRSTIFVLHGVKMSKDVHIVFQTLNYLRDAGLKLSDSEKLLLIFLAAHQGKFGIFPSIAMIGKEMDKNWRTVTRLLKSLEQKQIITVERESGVRSRYRLNYNQTPVIHDTPVTGDTPVIHDTPPLSSVVMHSYIGITKEITNTCASDVLKVKKTATAKSKEADQTFDKFWSAYPVKKGKAKAAQIWKRDKLDKMADEIIDKVKLQQAHDVQWQNPQYIPMASTYLNQQRWTDEITRAAPQQKPVSQHPAHNIQSTVKWFNNNH